MVRLKPVDSAHTPYPDCNLLDKATSPFPVTLIPIETPESRLTSLCYITS